MEDSINRATKKPTHAIVRLYFCTCTLQDYEIQGWSSQKDGHRLKGCQCKNIIQYLPSRTVSGLGGYSITCNTWGGGGGGSHANTWSPKSYVKSTFGVCK